MAPCLGLQGGQAVDDAGRIRFPRSTLASLPLMRAAGAGWVRINLRLGAAYRDWTTPGASGRTALAAYGEVIDTARALGLQVLALLSNETVHGTQEQWIENSAEEAGGSGDNPFLRAFAALAARLAEQWRGRVAAWEVWNEPDAWTQRSGSRPRGGTFLYPSNLAWLLRRTGEALRGAGEVISGGLFAHDIGGSRSTGAAYLRAALEAGRRWAGWQEAPFDGLGYHLYIDQARPASAGKVEGYLRDLRAAYLACEGQCGEVPIHVTEFGWRSDALGEEVQAQNLEVACAAFRRSGLVARAYWAAVQDIPEAGLAYGLLRADGTPKPAFAAYQRLAGSGGPGSAGVPPARAHAAETAARA